MSSFVERLRTSLPVLASRFCLLLLLSAADSACGSGSSCPAGTEQCSCYGNSTCNNGLACYSGLCVNAGGGASTDAQGPSSGTGGTVGGIDAANGGAQIPPENVTSDGSITLGTTVDAPLVSASGGVAGDGRLGSGGVAGSGGIPSNGGGGGGGLLDGGSIDRPQVSLPECGDGVISVSELCDDANGKGGDGCSPSCKIEPGFKCAGTPSVCSPTTCGDGKQEGTETCDDGNTAPFDGCSQDCQIDPNCSGGNGCTSACGDGLVIGEECDDGNAVDGDGCSKNCKVEPGWTCSQPPIGDAIGVPVIYRDFKFSKDTTGGNDFENGVTGSYNPTAGIVATSLDNKRKPVLSSNLPARAHVKSADTFAQWYTDVPGVNHATASRMPVWSNGKGSYVNRYGANGEQWSITMPANYCGAVADALLDAAGNPIPCTFKYMRQSADGGTIGSPTDCQKMEDQGYTQLPGSCRSDNGTYKARYITKKVDGTPLFFPVDKDTFSPASELLGAQLPPYYDDGKTWPFDVDTSGNKVLHNFSFTAEIHYWFTYETSKTYTLEFVSADDLWVFINGKLALDLGGVHTPVGGVLVLEAGGNGTATLTPFDAQGVATTPIKSTANLDLQNGKVYEIAVFYAERQSTSASLEVTFPPFSIAPSICVRQ